MSKSSQIGCGAQFTNADSIDATQLKLMFEAWPHGVFALDKHGAYVYQNTLDRAAFGDLTGKVAADLNNDTAEAENWSSIHREVLSGETVSLTITNEDGDPSAREVEIIMSPLQHDGCPIGILGMAINRSDAWRAQRERELAAQEVEASRDRLTRLADNVPGAIFEFVMDSTGQPKFNYVSSGMSPLLGTTTEALLENANEAFVHDHPDDAEAVQLAVERSFETLEPVNITHRINHPELGLRWHRVRATASRRSEGGVTWHGCIFDVTEERTRAEELEKAHSRMETLSLIDTLTGLPNRRACDAEMLRRATGPGGGGEVATVIRIDLDHFKSVNDTLGHEAGDAVLCRVGECLRDVVDEGDFAARLGGDEFVILLAPGKTMECAERTIDTLRRAIAIPLTHEGRHCRFDASFGVASQPRVPYDVLGLLSSADAALLQAKARGRGRTAVFTPELQRQITHTRKRAAEIKLALERNEFVPFFQPQIDAVSGELAGFEVLARWQHPEEGVLSPDEFVSVAEQLRVVQDLDKMMFEKAIGVLDRLQDDGFSIPKLAFNVSAARVHDPEIIRSVGQLQSNGTRVAFELLESILLEDETALFAHHIDQLKDMGVEIEVDDFGSGHASILGVLRVSPNTLKLDRRFILPMFDDQRAQALLKAMVDIGRSLKINVTAEGVETMEHAKAARALGCQTLQGYAFGKPMSEAALRSYLAGFKPAFSVFGVAV